MVVRVTDFGAETPSNSTPADGATGVSVTPFLVGSAFTSDLVIQEQVSEGSLSMYVSLAVSRDGVVFGPEIRRSLGESGRYERRVQWNDPGGLGQYESYMGMRMRTTAPVEFTPDSLHVDIANAKRS